MTTRSPLELARFNMIEQQIRPWDVADSAVLELLSVVKREDFVPAAHRSLAFVDMETPLPAGECMLSPRVEARALQDLHVKPTDTVLEIGAGSGYMAALLANRARSVVSLEIKPELAQLARENLRQAGIQNVQVREADGSQAGAVTETFDVIMLSGSVPEVPQALLQKLNVGGRLFAIVGTDPVMRAHLVTRTGQAAFTTSQPWDVSGPRLHGFPEPSAFHF